MRKITFDVEELDIDKVQKLADRQFEGNLSMAFRKILKEYRG